MAVKNITDLHVLGDVGIGTTSPSTKLEVNGDVKVTGSTSGLSIDTAGHASLRLDRAGTGYDNNIMFNTAGDTKFRIWQDGDSDYLYIRDDDNATNMVTFAKGGNVGIGTTSPTRQLHVAGPTFGAMLISGVASDAFSEYDDGTNIWKAGIDYSQSAYRITHANFNGAGISLDSSGNLTVDGNITTTNNIGVNLIELGGDAEHRLYRATTSLIKGTTTDTTVLTGRTLDLYAYDDVNIRAGSGDNISFTAGGVSNAMYINSAGNVGVGTTSPTDKLYVVGNVRAGDGSADNCFNAYHSDGSNTLYRGYGVEFNRSASYLRPTSDKNKTLNIGNDSRTWDTLNFNASKYYFNEDATTHLTILSGGNVGIGTTSPAVKLEVVGDTYLRTQLFTDTIRPYSADQLTLLNGGNNFLYVNGNVGIGTTSPSGKLHVKTDASSEFIFTGASTSGYATTFHMDNTGLDIGHNSTARALNLKTGSLDRLTILGNGNVGIGTTSPATYDAAKIGSGHRFLNVQSGANLYSVFTLAGNQSNDGDRIGYITFVNDANSSSYKYTAWIGSEVEGATAGQRGSRLIFSTMGNGSAAGPIERLRITSTGNVGIGTTSPEGLLHVKASDGNTAIIKIEGGNNVVTANGEINSRLEFGSNDGSVNSGGNVGGSIASVTENPNGAITGLAFSTFYQGRTPNDLAEAMRIDGSGNVGIGTTSPSEKLDVNGNINIPDQASYKIGGTSILTSSAVTGDTFLGIGNELKVNPLTYEFTFFGDNVLFGNLSPGAIPAQATLGLGDSGIVSDFPFSEALRIHSSGDIGIGTTNPSEKLEVDGNILASGDITAFSDARIKENVETLPNALESVKQMRGVTYNKIGEEKQSIGVIAQEVQAVLPQLVSEHNDGMLSVAYGNITAVLIEAIKELTSEVESLKAQLNASSK
jgi:hypothetical protein